MPDERQPKLPPLPAADVYAAFPEATAAARELVEAAKALDAADADAEAAPEGPGPIVYPETDGVPPEPEEGEDAAEVVGDPGDGVIPKRPPAVKRPGEGLRGSDVFVRHRPARDEEAEKRRATEGEPVPELVPGIVDPEAAARAAEAAAEALERKWAAGAAKVEAVLRIATNVLEPLEGKMNAVRVGLDMAVRSPEDRAQRMALMPKELHGLLTALTGRLMADHDLARRAQVALFQFSDAKRAVAGLVERMTEAAALPRDHGLERLPLAELPKAKGKLYVIANFPTVFRGDPVMSRLFPPRSPSGQTPPPPPGGEPAAPAQAPPPPRGTQPLKDAWDAVRDKLGKRKPG